MSQQVDFHERTLEEFSTRKSYFPIDDASREIPYLVPNPGQEIERPEDYQSHHLPPAVPIIAFLDPAKISDDKIDVPIAATLSEPDGTLGSRLEMLENDRDEIQQNVQDYIDGSSLTVDPDYWGLASSPSQVNLFSFNLWLEGTDSEGAVQNDRNVPVDLEMINLNPRARFIVSICRLGLQNLAKYILLFLYIFKNFSQHKLIVHERKIWSN